jgi:sigma-B regulation protein RsbU (phosphoserine phosphatase)
MSPAGRIQLRPGQVLTLYTDGITESMNHAGEQFEEERLEALIREHAGQKAQAILDSIYSAVTQHVAGAPQHDDLTLVVIKFEDQE